MSKKAVIGVVATLACAGWLLFNFMKKDEFYYAGTLETTKVILSSKVGTDILSLPIHEGDSVKKGELVTTLNDDSYKVASKQIDNEFQRYKRLLKSGHTTQEEYEKAERNKKENDLKIEWCRIASPIDGIVITKFREEGEYLTVGANILSIANPKEIWVYFYVPFDMISKIKVGDKVVGILQEMPEHKFNGKIIKINEEAEFTPKNVQTREERTRLIYGVKVQFENDDLTLKAGMTIETTFGHD